MDQNSCHDLLFQKYDHDEKGYMGTYVPVVIKQWIVIMKIKLKKI